MSKGTGGTSAVVRTPGTVVPWCRSARQWLRVIAFAIYASCAEDSVEGIAVGGAVKASWAVVAGRARAALSLVRAPSAKVPGRTLDASRIRAACVAVEAYFAGARGLVGI